jgi:RNA polymerase sigma-70 factor (ECF subfamily)
MRRLDRSAAGDRITEYHLEAAIAAAHATATDFASTDWRFIVYQYDQLYALNPSPVVALNRAVAISRAEGAEAGLGALTSIGEDASLANYYLFHATRARLYEELGDGDTATLCYSRALECECSPSERRFLERKWGAVSESRVSPSLRSRLRLQ